MSPVYSPSFTARLGGRRLASDVGLEVGSLTKVAATLTAFLLLVLEASGQQVGKPNNQSVRLYIYRPTTIIGIANFDVPFLHLNGKRLTRIQIGGHLSISVPPGKHKL